MARSWGGSLEPQWKAVRSVVPELLVARSW